MHRDNCLGALDAFDCPQVVGEIPEMSVATSDATMGLEVVRRWGGVDEAEPAKHARGIPFAYPPAYAITSHFLGQTWGRKGPRWHFVGTPERGRKRLKPLVRCCLPSSGARNQYVRERGVEPPADREPTER